MSAFLFQALASHRRGRVLRDVAGAQPVDELPASGMVLLFGEDFQTAPERHQRDLVEWTRQPGRVLLLLPPFRPEETVVPVPWKVERMTTAPSGGEGISRRLANEVTHRLTGRLQSAPIPGSTWQGLSVSTAIYRSHPASGVFAATCLPIWSLTVLDLEPDLRAWLQAVEGLAGEPRVTAVQEPAPLRPEHFGMLVFLLSCSFSSDDDALDRLEASDLFRFSRAEGTRLLADLQRRGLTVAATPTDEAERMVMESPYAGYVGAIREAAR